MYKLTVSGPNTELYVSIHQKDKRCVDAMSYIDIGVTLLKATTDPAVFTFVASSGNSMERQNQLDLEYIAPGEYYIVPTSSGAKMDQYYSDAVKEEQGARFDPTRSCVVAIHSSNASFKVDEISFDPLAYGYSFNIPLHTVSHRYRLFPTYSIDMKKPWSYLPYSARETSSRTCLVMDRRYCIRTSQGMAV